MASSLRALSGVAGSAMSTQTEGRSPRPTRPRSWCSWARPKRSACSMIMTEAFGTSTPTSITVVATRTSIRPSRKRAMMRSREAGLSRPCIEATCLPASSRCSRRATTSRRSRRFDAVPVSMAGTTTYACSPAATRWASHAYTSSRCPGETSLVVMGFRPGGRPLMVETSRSPRSEIAIVRGIGVAVMTRTCGVMGCWSVEWSSPAWTRNVARWPTPKRCCSSMIATASDANRTEPVMSAWVPMRMSRSAAAVRARMDSRCAAGVAPVSSSIRTREPWSMSEMDAKCCSASSSVGAMSAPWCSLATAMSMA